MKFQSSYNPVDSLHCYKWPGKGVNQLNPPKGVIIIFHGKGSHLGRYGHIATTFSE